MERLFNILVGRQSTSLLEGANSTPKKSKFFALSYSAVLLSFETELSPKPLQIKATLETAQAK